MSNNHRSSAPWLALAVLALGLFMTLLDLTIVNVAIPSIVDDLHDHPLSRRAARWRVRYLWRALRSGRPTRPGAGRLHRHPLRLAVDLLCESASRPDHARPRLPVRSGSAPRPASSPRLARRRA